VIEQVRVEGGGEGEEEEVGPWRRRRDALEAGEEDVEALSGRTVLVIGRRRSPGEDAEHEGVAVGEEEQVVAERARDVDLLRQRAASGSRRRVI